MREDDGVVLTDHERSALNALASGIDDGWLAYQLTGSAPPPTLVRPRWLAPALLVAGLFVSSIAAFSSWWWVGGLGLMLMAVGGWLTWQDFRQPLIPFPGAMTVIDDQDATVVDEQDAR
jgi:hypothetical protein